MKLLTRVLIAAAAALAMSVVAANAASPLPGSPSRPSSLKATAGDTYVSLSWVAPTVGKPITNYTVTRTPGGTKYPTPDGTPAYTVHNLVNGTQYTFTVTATNAIGTGSSSTPASATPRAIPPGRPTNLTATASNPGPGQTRLDWTPPTSNGSMPDGSAASITRYNITVSPGGTSTQVPAATTTYTASTPSDNVTYTFTVSATNTRPLTGAAATAYANLPTGANIGLQPAAGLATTAITVTGNSFLKNESITLYWDVPSHVAASVVTDGSGNFTKVVKPFAGDKPKVHTLYASVQPKPHASFTLRPPPPPTPKASPSPLETPSSSPAPTQSPQASGARTGGGGISGLDFITRPPFVFLPIIGIIGLVGVLAYLLLSGRRRPGAPPASATVVHRATRPDYMAPFGAPGAPPAAPQAPAQPSAWDAPVQSQPPVAAPQPVQPPPIQPLPQIQPPAPAPEYRPPAAAPPSQVEWPAPPAAHPPAAPDEPPDLPQPSD